MEDATKRRRPDDDDDIALRNTCSEWRDLRTKRAAPLLTAKLSVHILSYSHFPLCGNCSLSLCCPGPNVDRAFLVSTRALHRWYSMRAADLPTHIDLCQPFVVSYILLLLLRRGCMMRLLLLLRWSFHQHAHGRPGGVARTVASFSLKQSVLSWVVVRRPDATCGQRKPLLPPPRS